MKITICREHGIRHEICGKVVVATAEAESPATGLGALDTRGAGPVLG